MSQPKLIIFAGANGSGKTTAAEQYLKQPDAPFTDFINTDEIARGLSPFEPEAARISAGKIFFERFDEFIERRKSFSFETTLSGSVHAKYIQKAKDAGYAVHLVYLYLDDPLLSMARVKIRVQQGGHGVPQEDVKRRFKRSLYNLMNTYWHLCDTVEIVDANRAKYELFAYKDPKDGSAAFNPVYRDYWLKIRSYYERKDS